MVGDSSILTANAAVHEWHARCVPRKCAAAALIAQCRAHALEVGEPYGIWGGLSESDGDLLLNRETGRARSIGRTA
jgi:Transcription factor WhiB